VKDTESGECFKVLGSCGKPKDGGGSAPGNRQKKRRWIEGKVGLKGKKKDFDDHLL